MKKKIAVLLCVVVLMFTFSVFAFAEGEATGTTTGSTETMWNLWDLLNSSNVNYLSIVVILLQSLMTIVRMIVGGSGTTNAITKILDTIKNLLTGAIL